MSGVRNAIGNDGRSIVFALNAGHAKKRVINLRGVWANSNQSVQILESISQHPASTRHASTPNQLPPSADTTIARAITEIRTCAIISSGPAFFSSNELAREGGREGGFLTLVDNTRVLKHRDALIRSIDFEIIRVKFFFFFSPPPRINSFKISMTSLEITLAL